MKHVKSHSEKFWQACVVIMAYSLVFAISVFANDSKHKKGYTYNLEKLSQRAEKNIKKINKKLEKRKTEELNKEREREAKEYFEKGNALYKKSEFEKAKKEWQKALSITKDPRMRRQVKESKKRTKTKERTRRKKKKETKKQKEKKEKISKRPIYPAKEVAKDIKGKPDPRLGILRYKTERECFDALREDSENKEVVDNLAALYILRDEYIEETKVLYKKHKWHEAITECRKALAIEPYNEEAIRFIRKAKKKLEHLKNK